MSNNQSRLVEAKIYYQNRNGITVSINDDTIAGKRYSALVDHKTVILVPDDDGLKMSKHSSKGTGVKITFARAIRRSITRLIAWKTWTGKAEIMPDNSIEIKNIFLEKKEKIHKQNFKEKQKPYTIQPKEPLLKPKELITQLNTHIKNGQLEVRINDNGYIGGYIKQEI